MSREKKPVQPVDWYEQPGAKVKVSIEVTRKASAALGVFEGVDLVQNFEYELDPDHCDLKFAGTANEGWPSQSMEEMPSLREDMSKVLRAEGFLVCKGLVLRRIKG
jgi:hypothetical protein